MGNSGVIQAVGPVSARKGEANPWPVASELAILPTSKRKGMVLTAWRGTPATKS